LCEVVDGYFYGRELSGESSNTTATQRVFVKSLIWFLGKRGYPACGEEQLLQFFNYLRYGHKEPGGRFGCAHLNEPVRPTTVKDYYVGIRSLFAFLVKTGRLEESPFASIPKPRVPNETKPPLAKEDIVALMGAAELSTEPARNLSIIYFLLDTGCRNSELISIRLGDVDLKSRRCTVIGKGDKRRTLYFSQRTVEILAQHLAKSDRLESDGQPVGESYLFLSRDGEHPLTPSGLRQLLERLSHKAGIKGVCNPHAWRRTFAVQMLRNGANAFTVQELLGHTDLEMTRSYCRIAQTDVESDHRRFSPVDSLSLTEPG